jgi:glycosyltransferase involved in cell wall biosynthesis
MKRICSRHSHVEYRLVTGRDSHQMLAEQQQADIVIDQLYYGHWGSSGIEAMGTGAVVVAYLRADWITNFRREFSRYVDEIPVVSATAETLETVIETLVTDVELRRSLSAKSVNFARSFYDPESIALELARLLLDDRPWLNR